MTNLNEGLKKENWYECPKCGEFGWTPDKVIPECPKCDATMKRMRFFAKSWF